MILNIFAVQKWIKPAAYTGFFISGCMYIINSIISGIYWGSRGVNDIVAYLKGLGSEACSTGIVLKHGIAIGVTFTLVDFYILCLPLPSIWKMRLPLKQKLEVYFVFTMGIR